MVWGALSHPHLNPKMFLAVFSVTMWQNLKTVAKVDFPAQNLGQVANSQCRKTLRCVAVSVAEMHDFLKPQKSLNPVRLM